MLAGFAETDITPSVPCFVGGYGDNTAEEVLSPLLAKALYVQGEDSQWAICSCDLIGLDREAICLPVIKQLRENGFEGGLLLTASHTHSGPHTRFPTMVPVRRRDDAYIERLKKALVEIITLAGQTAVPAEVSAGRAFAGENINRRVNLEDGTHVYLPRQKELYQYATGVTDEEVGVVAFREVDMEFPVVTLVNYTAHPLTIGNYRWVVSADYPGVLSAMLTRLTGGAAMFSQGACGNVHPYGFETGPRRMKEMGERLAQKAYGVFTGLSYAGEPAVAWASREIELPVQKSMYEKDREYAPAWRDLDVIRTEMTAARVGDIAFVGAPGELFVEVGLAIKEKSPAPFTYVLYNTNDYVSYIPTKKAYEEGGFEPNATLVGPGGAEIVEQTALALLGSLY